MCEDYEKARDALRSALASALVAGMTRADVLALLDRVEADVHDED